MYCEHPCGDAEHTLFHCPRFEEERENVKKEIGSEIKTENLTFIMLAASEKWECIKKYMEEIIKVNERDEREGRVIYANISVSYRFKNTQAQRHRVNKILGIPPIGDTEISCQTHVTPRLSALNQTPIRSAFFIRRKVQ
ncbi:jg11680 [Pararge aegeria aegeria]|uniref:Jg11680 protein n=1 Tax=Pararge aegeria aegeria TaxID=348720 RepID=A0A8S4S5A4_9NEOP|nr:jg11680 [Pararge aegeria aegeria]